MYKAYSGTEQTLCAAVFYLRNRFSMEKGTGAQQAAPKPQQPILSAQVFPQESGPTPWCRPRKRVHTVEMTVPKPPKIFNDHRACV